MSDPSLVNELNFCFVKMISDNAGQDQDEGGVPKGNYCQCTATKRMATKDNRCSVCNLAIDPAGLEEKGKGGNVGRL